MRLKRLPLSCRPSHPWKWSRLRPEKTQIINIDFSSLQFEVPENVKATPEPPLPQLPPEPQLESLSPSDVAPPPWPDISQEESDLKEEIFFSRTSQ